ncbi:MAG TPA: hypothetical protein VFA33_30275 [Bryobacteraceae bacterium]|nr:hypothetical protein [Bryobacteraceae bacterium]
MACFPQLATGATSQYPVQKRRSARTVMNACLDGSTLKWADPAGVVTEWELHFAELTDEELAALETFFLSMEGTLGSFTFLDPAGNLLCWSEDLAQPAWTKDPLLTVTGGIDDAWGGKRGFRLQNTGGGSQRLEQTLAAPAGYCYALSLYARSLQGAKVRLLRGTEASECQIAAAWRRLVFAGQSQSNADNIAFGVELDAGAVVDVCGLQVEAQPWASPYKRSNAKGGVYTDARFSTDSLEITTEGPGQHGCVLRVIHADHI